MKDVKLGYFHMKCTMEDMISPPEKCAHFYMFSGILAQKKLNANINAGNLFFMFTGLKMLVFLSLPLCTLIHPNKNQNVNMRDDNICYDSKYSCSLLQRKECSAEFELRWHLISLFCVQKRFTLYLKPYSNFHLDNQGSPVCLLE